MSNETMKHTEFRTAVGHLSVTLVEGSEGGAEPYLWIGDSGDDCYLDSIGLAELLRLRDAIDKAYRTSLTTT